MELIFLDRASLGYKDYGYVDTDFELIVDMVVAQKSNFLVNKTNLNVSLGDVMVLKSNRYSYIGVIESIEVVDGVKTKILANDFKDIFNVKVPILSYEGDVCTYLKELIEKNFIKNQDENQNLSYLEVRCDYQINATLNFQEDNLMSISEMIEFLNKAYGIYIKYEVKFLRGRFYKIVVIVDSVKSNLTIKDNLTAIRDVIVSDSEEQAVNKVIFYPKAENEETKEIITYYLLKDGSITKNKNDSRRFKSVSFTSEYYGDKDYVNLETRARSLMSSKGLDHSITFNLDMNNEFFIPLNNMFLGDYVNFIYKDKSYETVVTQFKFKGSFLECFVTLGEFRNKLTDKIKLLTKNANTSVKNFTASGTSSGNVDGGTY